MEKTAQESFHVDSRFLAPAARFGSGGLSQSDGFISWFSSLPQNQYQMAAPGHEIIFGHHSVISWPITLKMRLLDAIAIESLSADQKVNIAAAVAAGERYGNG